MVQLSTFEKVASTHLDQKLELRGSGEQQTVAPCSFGKRIVTFFNKTKMNSLFPELLEKFAQSLGMDSFQFDEHGECVLRFDEVFLQMHLLDEGECLLLNAPLGNPPSERRPELYQQLLSANCLFQKTGGATLGVADTGEVMLTARLDVAGCNISRWEQTLENFLNIADAWRQTIESSVDESALDLSPVTPHLHLGEGIRV